jgi:exopolyphosphatase/guanosine-5'-triphosphate,3'-diphosphate pyrophosphatase
MARTPSSKTAPRPDAKPAATARRLLGVIDVGARAIRLEIVETGPGDRMRILDSLEQPVDLGKDTFGEGRIRPETVEQCVRVLRSYRTVLSEYGLDPGPNVRAVATSAVREASNRDFFLDRVYIATGLALVCLDEVELNRLTYLAVRDLLTRQKIRTPSRMLVLDVGGGTTEVLLLEDNRVVFSETYRIGALRIRERFEALDAPEHRLGSVLALDLGPTIESMRRALPRRAVPYMVAMSADARRAAARLSPDWPDLEVARLPAGAFGEYAGRVARMDADQVVRTCGVSYAEAETFGTALLTIREIAHAFGVRHILVPKASLRTALEIDLAGRPTWNAHLREQVEGSALTLAGKYRADLRHARLVAGLCDRLFEELREEHGLDASHGFLLRIAALLHEIGQFIGNRNHHRHSQYLILHSDLFGLTRDEIQRVALIARYHRRGHPVATQSEIRDLPRDHRLAIYKLTAILRVADSLERSHIQPVSAIEMIRKPGRLILTLRGAEDLSLERMALQEKGGWFEDVFGMKIELRPGPLTKGSEANV